MKKKLHFIKWLALIVLAVSVAACDATGSVIKDISGTEWINESIPTFGSGLLFTSTTTGKMETETATIWTVGTAFTYNYNEFNKTGTITLSGTSKTFAIVDNKLTYDAVIYTKK